MALSKYDKEFLTDKEQETIASLTKAYEEGRLSGESAHGAAEAIRAKYGYSGGDDGGKYISNNGTDAAQAIYDSLVARGDNKNKSALERLAQMTYSDWKNGGEYQTLQDMYRRQGNQMMEDVVGRLSARTGGLASSYASAAAAQQYNDVMSQLEAVARQMYEGDRSNAMDIYNLERAAADTAYNRAMYEREYNDKQTLQRQQDAEKDQADARERVNAYLAAGGSAASLDRSLLEASGYSDAEIAAFEKYYAQQLASKKSTGKGEDAAKNSKLYKDILSKAQKYDDYDDAISYLNRMVESGQITEEEKNTIDSVYLGGTGEESEVPKFTTYEQAASYLSEKSLSPSGLMTEREWTNRKKSYERTGVGGASVKDYSTYKDYLNDYILYQIESNS